MDILRAFEHILPLHTLFWYVSALILFQVLLWNTGKKWILKNKQREQEKVLVLDIEEFVRSEYEKKISQSDYMHNRFTSEWINNILGFIASSISSLPNSELCSKLEKLSREGLKMEFHGETRTRVLNRDFKKIQSTECLISSSRYCRYMLSHSVKSCYRPEGFSLCESISPRFCCKMNIQGFISENHHQGVYFTNVRLGNSCPFISSIESRPIDIEDTCLIESIENSEIRSMDLLRNPKGKALTFTLTYDTDKGFLVEGSISIPVENIVTLPTSFRITRLRLRTEVSLVMVPRQERAAPLLFGLRLHEAPEMDITIESALGSTNTLKNNATVHALIKSIVGKLFEEGRMKPPLYFFD